MSFSTFITDYAAMRNRGEWLVEFYIKDPSGVETILRYSYRGTTIATSAITVSSDTIAAHTAFKKRIGSIPEISQSLWQSGKILSSSLPTIGSILLVNADGGLDQYSPAAGYRWSGCRCKIFFCDSGDIQNTIGKVFDGFLGEPNFVSLGDVEISLQGREYLFEVPVSDRVYRGTGYMLELSGVRAVNYGTPAATDLRTSMTVSRWLWIDTTPSSNIAPLYGWNGATFPWRLNLTTARQLSFRGVVAGVTQGPTATTVLSAQTNYHIAVVVSGVDVTFYIWNDDAQTLTTETFTGAFTNSTRDAQVGGNLVDQTTGTAVVWFDESRLWNVARTATEIAADRFREISTIPSSLVHYVRYNDGTGTTVTDSSATAANGTISGAGTSTWLWANEGGPELAGTPKADIWGERWGVAPVLVDPVRQGYQVVGGGAIQDITSYEGGNAHTMSSAASYRAYLTTTPAAGASLRYLPRGLFKLGSQPTLPVSALVKGYNGGSLGYVDTGATVIRDIITRRGPKLTDPTDLDTSSFATYATANPGILGVYVKDTSASLRSVLDSVTVSGSGWWGYSKGSLLFHLEKFAGPAITANYSLSERHAIDIRSIPLPVVYEVVVKYRHNDVVLSEDQVAGAVKSTLNWQQWTQEWQEQRRSDLTLRAAYPGDSSVSLTFETNLQYSTDAGSLADYLLALLKGVKLAWTFTVTGVGFQMKIGETTKASLNLQRNSLSGGVFRVGLDGSDNYAILGTNDNYMSGSCRLELWG